MPPSPTFSLPENLPPEVTVSIILTSLKTVYQRQVEQLTEIVTGFDQLNIPKLTQLWVQLSENTDSDEDALTYFTEWVSAQLDGGNLTVR